MIVALCGSGREEGNGARLLAAALEGAASAGAADLRRFHLGRLSFKGCTGCRRCRESSDACVHEDGLTEVLAAVGSASAVAFAAPIYYGYVNGLAKSFLDRWYAFRNGQGTLRVPQGRPALLILTQGNPDRDAYAWTAQSLERVLTSYGFEPRLLVGAGLEGARDAEARPELLAEARRLGGEIAGRLEPGTTGG